MGVPPVQGGAETPPPAASESPPQQSVDNAPNGAESTGGQGTGENKGTGQTGGPNGAATGPGEPGASDGAAPPPGSVPAADGSGALAETGAQRERADRGDTLTGIVGQQSGAFAQTLPEFYASAPQFDTKPFGPVPRAEPPRDPNAINEGESITLYDDARRGMIEEQRRLLGDVHGADARVLEAEQFADRVRSAPDVSARQAGVDAVAKARADAETARGALAAGIQNEIQHAGTAQPVPSDAFVAQVTGDIRARNLSDPIYQAAVDTATQQAREAWQSQGRTPDQLGAVLESADAGDMAGAQRQAYEQFVAVGEQAQSGLPEDATAVERTATVMNAIMERGAIYRTFGSLDPRLGAEGTAAFQSAIDGAMKGAATELTVNRPVDVVVEAGKDGSAAAGQKLGEVAGGLDPKTARAILDHPEMQPVLQQLARDAAEGEHDGDQQLVQDILGGVSAAAQSAALDGDRSVVDKVARYFTDEFVKPPGFRINFDLGSGAANGADFFTALKDAGRHGNIALTLSMAEQAAAGGHDLHAGQLYGAAAQGIAALNDDLTAQLQKAREATAFAEAGRAEWGTAGSEQEAAQKVAELYAQNPDKAKAAAEATAELARMTDLALGVNETLKAYSAGVNANPGLAEVQSANAELQQSEAVKQFGDNLMPPDARTISTSLALWSARMSRLLATETINLRPGRALKTRTLLNATELAMLAPSIPILAGFEEIGFQAYAPFFAFNAGLLAVELHGNVGYLLARNGLLPAGSSWAQWGQNMFDEKTAYQTNPLVARARNLVSASFLALDVYNTGYYVFHPTAKDPWYAAAFGVTAASDITYLLPQIFSKLPPGPAYAVGAALAVAGAAIYSGRALYNNAHQFDADSAGFLKQIGVRSEIADIVSEHAVGVPHNGISAAPSIVSAYRKTDSTPTLTEFAAYLNLLSPEQAKQMRADALKEEQHDAGNWFPLDLGPMFENGPPPRLSPY